jgi:hypothetical protein
MVIYEFNIYSMVQSTVVINCGAPMVTFQTSMGFHISTVFNMNACDINGWCSVSIYSVDITIAGSYELQFFFYYAGMPSISVYSNVFVVIVIDICVPPPGCINIPGCGIPDPVVNPPSVDIEIEVTVGVDISIDLPSWNCGTPGCDSEVIITCGDCDIGSGNVVVVIDNHIDIHIGNCVTIDCGNTPAGNTIIVVVVGCITIDVCSEVDVPITIYNPCTDPAYVSIIGSLIPDFTYTPYQEGCFSHPPFTVSVEIEMLIEICGPLVYTVDAGDYNI